MKSSFLLTLLFVLTNQLSSQKTITLEDIWQKGTFNTKSVPGFNFMNDGQSYSKLERGTIQRYDLLSGSNSGTLFEASTLKGKAGYDGTLTDYSFNLDESKILISTASKSIYRHSSKSTDFVYDTKSKLITPVYTKGKISNATFSPDGSMVAFVHENNLYYKNLVNDQITQITLDGAKNKIINGMCDWVNEEEFGLTKAFAWNAKSDKIAFIRFDETEVKEFTMQFYHNQMYPINETFKYPKVGEANAKVSVIVFDIKKGKNTETKTEDLTDMYIPRINWTNEADKLCITVLNRLQNHLKLYLYDTNKRESKVMLEEKNKYYVDIHDNITFLKDNKTFIWTSEKNGYNQIFVYDMNGNEKKCLTPGQFDIMNMYGYDENNKKIYYLAAEKSPMEHQVFEVDLDGKNKRLVTPYRGMNSAQFSKTYDYYVNTNSTANTAPTYTVYQRDGKEVRVIEGNTNNKNMQEEYEVQPIEFFDFTTSEGVKLNGWMMKPKNFNKNRKYPVFMTQYSGPGSQQVTDGWKGANYWWYQHLAQEGYIVACVDPRGTGARGEEFKKMTYMQLTHYEVKDQIEAAKYLGGLAYADKTRIGIFGWSYGGHMSSQCILIGNDVFKAAIAVAPVTNWKWYDSIYTERYMRTYKENKKGYDDNNPVNFADRLKGKFLLCHGLADDNVHFQHTVEMANALIDANKQFDTYFYPNRNHGIYGGNARIHLYTKMTNFILENI